MAKKYVNYRVGGTPEKKDENYTVWSNDLLTKLIASKTVVEPNKSTLGHRLLESEVIYVILSGRGLMEVIGSSLGAVQAYFKCTLVGVNARKIGRAHV